MFNYKNWKRKSRKKKNQQLSKLLCKRQELKPLSLIFQNGRRKRKRWIWQENMMKIDSSNLNKQLPSKLKKKKRLCQINKSLQKNLNLIIKRQISQLNKLFHNLKGYKKGLRKRGFVANKQKKEKTCQPDLIQIY